MANECKAKGALGLLDLPAEVRHQIYHHLFCPPVSGYLSLRSRRSQHTSGSWFDETEFEPMFQTALFRVNRAISRDTLTFAYSVNKFDLPNKRECFLSLGDLAFSSIRILSVQSAFWLQGEHSKRLLETIQSKCTNLQTFIIKAHELTTLNTIPHLDGYFAAMSPGLPKTRMLLDVYVWDNHFAFEGPERSYQATLRSFHAAGGTLSDYPDGCLGPRERALHIPTNAKQVVVVFSITAGVFRALDDYLEMATHLHFVKTEIALEGYLDGITAGRTRHCYAWLADPS